MITDTNNQSPHYINMKNSLTKEWRIYRLSIKGLANPIQEILVKI